MRCLQSHMQLPCAPAQTLDRIHSGLGTGALHPSWHRLLWQKSLSPTASGAGPLVQSRLNAFKSRPASQALISFISYGWSCCPALCWLVSLLSCALGMSSQARNREKCTWCCVLAHGKPFGWGKHQEGEVEWWCWGSTAWGWPLCSWLRKNNVEQGWHQTVPSSDICCRKHFWTLLGLKVLLTLTKPAFEGRQVLCKFMISLSDVEVKGIMTWPCTASLCQPHGWKWLRFFFLNLK